MRLLFHSLGTLAGLADCGVGGFHAVLWVVNSSDLGNTHQTNLSCI